MGQIAPTDVVPALRHNLAFSHSPPGLGAGLVSVKNVDSGEEFMLRGFEYSLARMLDGHRTAAEVVGAADQVGLPVTLADLNGFVKKLSDRHLVRPGNEPVAADDLSPWTERTAWDQKRREQFRAALREGRAGNLDRALLSLDILLNEHPDTPEAIKLRVRLEARRQAPDRDEPFCEVFAQTEKGWQQGALPTSPALTPERAVRIAAVLCGLAAVAIVAVTLLPVPLTITTQTTLVPISSSKVLAPRTGTIGEVQVKPGQWVDQGTVLFSYDTSDTLRQLEGAVTRLDALTRGLYTGLPSTRAAKAAKARFTSAADQLRRAEAARDDGRVPLQTSQAALNLALDEHMRAREALDAFVPEDKRTALLAQRTEVQQLETQVLDSEVEAPVSGAVTAMLGAHPHAEVFKGQEVVQLDDQRKLKALITVEARDRQVLEPGQRVLLVAEGRAATTQLTVVSGRSAELIIDNADLAFESGPAEVQIRARPAPLVR